MIAVALVAIHSDFHIEIGTSTWLVSAFYLTGAVGQPLMGRLADLWGGRRVFLAGTAVAGLVGAVAPLSPGFGWLVAARAVQALATSTAFPSGLGLIRAASGDRVPASALAVLGIAGSTSAGLGPTIGGFLVSTWGWQAIFLVNVPITAAAIILGLRWMPAPAPASGRPASLSNLDLPGVVLFAATLIPVLGVLLFIGSIESLILAAVIPLAATLLAIRETRFPTPFFDIRFLIRNPAIIGVFIQFAAVTFIFYSFFLALPIWLQQVGGYDAKTAGLLVFPLTGMAIVMTPLAARLIDRAGPQLPLIIGSAFMLAGSATMLALGRGTPIVVLLLITFVLGIPNAFNTLGLQAVLYAATPRERTSWAAGQFQTFRYVGATLGAAVLGSVFRHGATTPGLHGIAMVLGLVSVGLVAASVGMWRRGAGQPQSSR